MPFGKTGGMYRRSRLVPSEAGPYLHLMTCRVPLGAESALEYTGFKHKETRNGSNYR